MFLEAWYSSNNSVRSRTHRSPSLGSSALSLEYTTSEFRPSDPPLPDIETSVEVSDGVVPLRFSVGLRRILLFGLVFCTSHSQSMNGGHAPAGHVLGRTFLFSGFVETSVRCRGPLKRVLSPRSVQYWRLRALSGFSPGCHPQNAITALCWFGCTGSPRRLPSVTRHVTPSLIMPSSF